MPVRIVHCPECEAELEISSATRKPSISCPMCGERVPVRRRRAASTHRSDAFDELDEPPRRSRRGKKRSSDTKLFVGLGVGAVALVLVAVLAINGPKLIDKFRKLGEPDWQEYTSAAGQYTILMPGEVESKTLPLDTPFGKRMIHQAGVGSRHGAYVVSFHDYPEVAAKKPDELLDAVCACPNETVLSTTPFTREGHPGREVLTDAVIGGKPCRRRIRVFVVDRRAYRVSWTGRTGDENAPNATKFLDSFRLQGVDGPGLATKTDPKTASTAAPPTEQESSDELKTITKLTLKLNFPADAKTKTEVRKAITKYVKLYGYQFVPQSNWTMSIDGRLVSSGKRGQFEAFGAKTTEPVDYRKAECTISLRRGGKDFYRKNISGSEARASSQMIHIPRGQTAQQYFDNVAYRNMARELDHRLSFRVKIYETPDGEVWIPGHTPKPEWVKQNVVPQKTEAPTAVAKRNPPLRPTVPRDPVRRPTTARSPQFTVESALGELQLRTSFDRVAALEFLAKTEVEEKSRKEVSRALSGMLADAWGREKPKIIDALAHWDREQAVTVAIGMLGDSAFFNRAEGIDILAKLEDPRGAVAVAQRMTDRWDAQKASAALKTMGPVAEDTVLGLLSNKHWSMRREACNILAIIGTAKKSLPRLKRLARDKNRDVRDAAKNAVTAITARGKG